jgi:hypothetical protein
MLCARYFFEMNVMEVIDDVMDIHLPLQKVFKWRSKPYIGNDKV